MKTWKLLWAMPLAMVSAAQAQNLPAPLLATPNNADASNRAATTAWVRAQGYLSSAITAGQVSSALGFAPQRAAVFNVLDYGAVADGATDLGPALRAIAAKLGGSGAPNEILIPAGHYALSSAVVFTGGAPVLRGQGFTAGPNPASGTWITVSGTGFVPFTFSGIGARGAAVRDIAINQAQPAPTAGWAPTNYDYVFKALNALGEVTFDNVLFAGVTRGIYADNSGRLNVKNVAGQFYVAGIEIDDCYDIPRIEHLHAWTYATSSPYVTAWQEAQLDTVILRRVDGIFIGDLFSYAARSALYLTSGQNGVTTKLYLKSLYADFVKYGVWIDAAGVNGQIAQATTQNQDAAAGGGAMIAGGRGLYVTGNTAQLQIGAWRTNSVSGPVVDLEGNNAHVVISDFWANTYGFTPGDGTAAVFAVDTGSGPANFVQVLGTPMLQGVAPLYLYNAGVNAGRLRMPSMNSVGNAVNEPRLYDGAAGNPVSVAAIGADARVDLQLQAKSSAGSVRLQSNGQTVLRTDNPAAGDSDLLARPGTGALNLIVESASASADLVLAAKGAAGGVRLQAQGATVVRLDNPGSGTSDLLVRAGNQTVALTVEDPGANANLVLNPKGAGTVALGNSPLASDNSTNVVTSAWVVGQHYLTSAPVASVAGRTGSVTLGVADIAGAAPMAAPTLTGGVTVAGGLRTDGLAVNGPAPGGAGFARSGTYVLQASTTSATSTRLTTDGQAPSVGNCVNLPNGSAYSASVDITGIDRTTGASAARYRLLDIMLLRGTSAAATSLVNGVSTAAPNGSVGSGSATSFSAAADTTNGCLALSVTPPNADAWHWAARVVTTEVQ